MSLEMPTSMSAELEGYHSARDTVGKSGGSVYRVYGKEGAPDLYLKHGIDAVADDVTDEMVKLRWLAGHIPVPSVVKFIRNSDQAWLLMTALEGQTAYHVLKSNPDSRPAVIEVLAALLRRLHAIPVSECSFNSDHPFRLCHARKRIDTGMVNLDDFDEEREGWTAEQVWQAMQRLLPFDPDPVVTHGDFSLDNILIRDGEVTGCIDVGRTGIADRYQDISIFWNSVGEFGPLLQDKFLREYGLPGPDQSKLDFHLMLDEFF